MRKRFLVFLLLALVLAVTGTAGAQSADDLVAFADYFPADTSVFAAIRTDDAYLNTLDNVLATIAANSNELIPSSMSVRDLLDRATFDTFGLSFDRSLGWLGDTVALGIVDLSGMMEGGAPDMLLAADVGDAEAAAEFMDYLTEMSGGMLEPVAGEGYTFYDIDGMVEILFADDVAFLSTVPGLAEAAFGGMAATLAENEMFTGTIASLPAESYNIITYMDAGRINANTVAMMEEQMAMEGMAFDFNALMPAMEADATVAIGLTLIDERSLVIDMATSTDAEMALAMPGYIAQQPIDLDFAAHVAAGSQLVILDNGFGPDALALFDQLDALGPMLDQMLDVIMEQSLPSGMETEYMDEMELMMLDIVRGINPSVINFGGLLKQGITPIFAGFTGLNLEKDVLAWMDGDYAMVINLIAVDSPLEISLDAAAIIEATDPEKAAYIVERLAEVEALYGGEPSITVDDTGSVLELPNLIPAFLPEEIAEMVDSSPATDILIGANDAVFAAGTRPSVEYALDSMGSSLLDDEAFTYVTENLMLDDSVLLWYIGTPGMVDVATHAIDAFALEDAEMIPFILSQVESLTISGAVPGDGESVVRMTITLPESVQMDTE